MGLTALAAANLAISYWMGQQAYSWMPPQASAESVLVDKLFSFMTAIGTFIFIGVIGTLLYSVVFQRAAKYDSTDGPPIEGNLWLEVVWTAVPIMLIIWIGTVSYSTYDQMSLLSPFAPQEMKTPGTVPGDKKESVPGDPEPTQTFAPIEVHSRQWAWEFRYPEDGVSSTELHLPVNQRARFKLTSEDVLHGFFVPAFRVKQDIVPGREIDFSFTPIREGRYRLRDSEYSGTYFAANQTNVVVESEEEYRQWLLAAAQNPPTAAENVAFESFSRAVEGSISLGWATVRPAPAPIVNYTSSEKDSYE
ncbi:cytochrome c oxidase subunit II [Nodosilinea nodulosa]|uniref:cytochrome c oxidase subunit II n=1 Tax=Nodosilinea nodulosa TaxID=416001 RepID=UPI0002FD0BBC|nr:cytochrome c oxidase subunit II [Nodosilinea nodulosa]